MQMNAISHFVSFNILSSGTCPYGQFLNISEPRVYTAGEYPGSYKYGAWGRDPKPEAGKESWYWRVILTSSNRYAHYVRFYSTLSSLIIGVSIPGKNPSFSNIFVTYWGTFKCKLFNTSGTKAELAL